MRSRPDPPPAHPHPAHAHPTYCQLHSQHLAALLTRAHSPTHPPTSPARTLPRYAPSPPSLDVLRQRHSQLQNLHVSSYQELQSERDRLAAKARRAVQERTNLQNNLQAQLETSRCLLDQITIRAAHHQAPLPQALHLTDLLLTPPRGSPIRRRRSRAMASPLIEASLLLSCKKEEEGYVTLKYSEESNLLRHRHRESEPISEEKHIRRISEKEEYLQQPDTLHGEHSPLWTPLHHQKDNISAQTHQIRSAINSYEDLLDRIVTQVAEEKVEAETTWSHLVADTDHSLAHLRSLLATHAHAAHRFFLAHSHRLALLDSALSTLTHHESSSRQSAHSQLAEQLLSSECE